MQRFHSKKVRLPKIFAGFWIVSVFLFLISFFVMSLYQGNYLSIEYQTWTKLWLVAFIIGVFSYLIFLVTNIFSSKDKRRALGRSLFLGIVVGGFCLIVMLSYANIQQKINSQTVNKLIQKSAPDPTKESTSVSKTRNVIAPKQSPTPSTYYTTSKSTRENCQLRDKVYQLSRSDCLYWQQEFAKADALTEEIKVWGEQILSKPLPTLPPLPSSTYGPIPTVAPIQSSSLPTINIPPTPCVVYLAPGGPPVSTCN